MEFIYSNERRNINIINSIIEKYSDLYPSKELYRYSGDWGCLVSTGSQYHQLDPYDGDDRVVIVSGDPLCGAKLETAGEKSPNSMRTAAIARVWKAGDLGGGTSHPHALICVCKASGSIRIRTDAWGSIPVYHGVAGDSVVIGSSPDLVAMALPSTFDRISAIERLCTRQITYPHTLYANIRELPSGSTTTISKSSGPRAQRWWHAPFPEQTPSQQYWVDAFQE